MMILSFNTSAFAAEIVGSRKTSQVGMSQAEWEASDTFKSFTCPDNASMGMGVDLNFTTNKNDDTWFVYCLKKEILSQFVPVIDSTTVQIEPQESPQNTLNNKETQTVTLSIQDSKIVQSEFPTVTIQASTVLNESTTVKIAETTSQITLEELRAEIRTLMERLRALIRKINK